MVPSDISGNESPRKLQNLQLRRLDLIREKIDNQVTAAQKVIHVPLLQKHTQNIGLWNKQVSICLQTTALWEYENFENDGYTTTQIAAAKDRQTVAHS